GGGAFRPYVWPLSLRDRSNDCDMIWPMCQPNASKSTGATSSAIQERSRSFAMASSSGEEGRRSSLPMQQPLSSIPLRCGKCNAAKPPGFRFVGATHGSPFIAAGMLKQGEACLAPTKRDIRRGDPWVALHPPPVG